jgi:hypothetical protein
MTDDSAMQISYIASAGAVLKRIVPDQSFSLEMALVCAGLDPSDEGFSEVKASANSMLMVLYQLYGAPVYNENNGYKRFEVFLLLARCWPNDLGKVNRGCLQERITLKSLLTTKNCYKDAARLIFGCKDMERRLYQGCINVTKIIEKRSGEPKGTPIDYLKSIHEHDERRNSSNFSKKGMEIYPKSQESMLSPLSASADSRLSFGSLGTMTSSTTKSSNPPPSLKNDGTATSTSRRTSKEVQEERTSNREFMLKREALYTVGTILLSKFKERKLPGVKSFAYLVNCLNGIFGGEEYVNKRELSQAVKAGRIGISPPVRTANSRLPDKSFEALADLIFSHSALSQSNGEGTITKPKQIQLLGAIVDPYFIKRKEQSMNMRELYERVQTHNSNRQHLHLSDKREAVRYNWLTWENLLKHYVKLELFLVEKGFARKSSEEEIKKSGEQVKWYPDQLKRALNFDEMGFSLDHSKNGKGGRPPTGLGANDIKDSGKPDQKSSQRVTLLFTVNFAGEALPGVMILPSSASSLNVNSYLLEQMPQICGKFGHSVRKGFDFMIASSPNGSMTAEILTAYCLKLVTLYPDVRDEDGHRLFVKADSGQGRDNAEFLAAVRSMGIYFYPGVPNTSEATQECDQLFSYTKSLMERNREELVLAKIKHNLGEVKFVDLPVILFGADFQLPDGSNLKFKNAFHLSFSKKHILSAVAKCGYSPANRAALRNPKCRKPVGVNKPEGECVNAFPRNNVELQERLDEIDISLLHAPDGEEVDVYAELLKDLEVINRDSVELLDAMGFKAELAFKERKEVNTYAPSAPVMLTCHTREQHQDLLAHSKSAGGIFRTSNGGMAQNCDDMLMGIERKKMKLLARSMKTKRAELLKTREIIEKAEDIVANGGPNKLDDYKWVIQWKTGDLKKPTEKKNVLKKKWEEELKEKDVPRYDLWTEKCEEKYEKLLAGEVTSLRNTSLFKRGYGRALQCLHDQALLMNQSTRRDFLVYTYASLTNEERQKLKEIQKQIDDGRNVDFPLFPYNFIFEDEQFTYERYMYNEELDDSLSESDSESLSSLNKMKTPRRQSEESAASITSAQALEFFEPVDDSLSESDSESSTESFNSLNKMKTPRRQSEESAASITSAQALEFFEPVDVSLSESDSESSTESFNSLNEEKVSVVLEEDKQQVEDSLNGSTEAWESMTHGNLLNECKAKGINKVTKRWKKETMIRKLEEYEGIKSKN